jgi:hypothetical protein
MWPASDVLVQYLTDNIKHTKDRNIVGMYISYRNLGMLFNIMPYYDMLITLAILFTCNGCTLRVIIQSSGRDVAT